MYADDLMIMSELKINVKKMLSIIELFGQTNGMKFNPEKTELIVFNFTVKRTLKVRMKDMWQEGLESISLLFCVVSCLGHNKNCMSTGTVFF